MTTPTIQEIAQFMEQVAPVRLAETWDNVGLLIGDPRWPTPRIMTCLTVTAETAREAVDRGARLIVTHHPCPFHSVKRLTTETPIGRILLELLGSRIALYSAHTAFDSATRGINQRIAEGLGLVEIQPLLPESDAETDSPQGIGRVGYLAEPVVLDGFAARAKAFFEVESLQVVGRPDHPVRTVAVTCGAAGSLVAEAKRAEADVLLLGETQMHTCLEAIADGLALVMPGHYASERFAMEQLADDLADAFPGVETWASQCEADPIRWA